MHFLRKEFIEGQLIEQRYKITFLDTNIFSSRCESVFAIRVNNSPALTATSWLRQLFLSLSLAIKILVALFYWQQKDLQYSYEVIELWWI